MSTRQRILYLASRPCLPVSGGRERMISQSLDFITREHDVAVILFHGRQETVDLSSYRQRWPQATWHLLPLPGLPTLACNLVQALLRGTPLQNALFISADNRRQYWQIVHNYQPDCIVCDMARTAQFAVDATCATVVDLDDLLSQRYQRQASRKLNSLWGTYQQKIPPLLQSISRPLQNAILRLEAKRMADFENACPHQFDEVILVSPREARLLAERSGCTNITAIPQAAAVTRPVDTNSARLADTTRMVFIGNLRTQQNHESFLYFLQEIAPALDRAVPGWLIDVYGAYGEDIHAAWTASPHQRQIRLHGFVDDLAAAVNGASVHIAPILSGSGIKTKILDSFAYGIPTLTTTLGTEGLDVTTERELIVCHSADAFASQTRRILDDRALQAHLVQHSAAYLAREHDPATLQQRYLAVIENAINQHAARR